eukprot:1150630-Pelagomonas_calceolata.AAC.1
MYERKGKEDEINVKKRGALRDRRVALSSPKTEEPPPLPIPSAPHTLLGFGIQRYVPMPFPKDQHKMLCEGQIRFCSATGKCRSLLMHERKGRKDRCQKRGMPCKLTTCTHVLLTPDTLIICVAKWHEMDVPYLCMHNVCR